MDPDSLLGVWTGIAHHSNGWDMKMRISIFQPVAIGSMLGVFDIPMLPCSGSLRVVAMHDELFELRADKLQGECEEADSYTLEWLADGTLEYIMKGKGWESRAVLARVG
jgi:hypothetical protein